MKASLLILRINLIALFTFFLIQNSFSQTIDSVVVKVQMSRSGVVPNWQQPSISIDSLSGGRVICSKSMSYFNGKWANSQMFQYTYLNSNDLIITKYRWLNNQWTPNTRNSQIRVYGQVDSLAYEIYQNNSWSLQSYSFRVKDLSTGLVVTVHTRNGMDSTETNYRYDLNNNLIDVDNYRYNFSFDEWIPQHEQFFWKTPSGVDTLSIYNEYEGSDPMKDIIYSNKMSFTLDSLERIIQIISGNLDLITNLYTYTDTGYIFYTQIGDTIITTSFPDSNVTYQYVKKDTMGNLIHLYNKYAKLNSSNREEYSSDIYYLKYPQAQDFVLYKSLDTLTYCVNNNGNPFLFTIGGYEKVRYRWEPATSVSNDTLQFPEIISTLTGWLKLTSTDTAGRVLSDSIYINPSYPPVINSVITENPTCIGCTDGYFLPVYSLGDSSNAKYVLYNLNTNYSQNFQLGDTLGYFNAGPYQICLMDYNGCGSCVYDTLFDGPTSLNEFATTDVHMYPNPAHDFVNITNLCEKSSFAIINMAGKVLYTKNALGDYNYINLSGFTKGSYLLRYKEGEIIFYKKLIVE